MAEIRRSPQSQLRQGQHPTDVGKLLFSSWLDHLAMDHDEGSAARGMNDDESPTGTVTPMEGVAEEPRHAVAWSAGQPTASANTTLVPLHGDYDSLDVSG